MHFTKSTNDAVVMITSLMRNIQIEDTQTGTPGSNHRERKDSEGQMIYRTRLFVLKESDFSAELSTFCRIKFMKWGLQQDALF